MSTFVFWLLFLAFLGIFIAQVARRVQLIASAPDTFAIDDIGGRVRRFVTVVVCQRRSLRERPAAGLMHAFVFWAFVAFGGYTTVEFLYGLGLAVLTHTGWFEAYRQLLVPFAVAVLIGISYLWIRRTFVRPIALGTHVSGE